MSEVVTQKKLTKREVRNSFFMWALLVEASNSYERMQALSFCVSIMKPLRKLYDDEEAYREALERHLQFFNSEGTFGSLIGGITLSMEEENSGRNDYRHQDRFNGTDGRYRRYDRMGNHSSDRFLIRHYFGNGGKRMGRIDPVCLRLHLSGFRLCAVYVRLSGRT